MPAPEKSENRRPPTVALDFLGCKLNQAEIQEFARELAEAGYAVAGADEPADIYVLNTCTVTRTADRKSRQMLRQARRRNPSARLVAMGCYAEHDAAALSCIEGVELVLGNDAKHDLVKLLGPAGEPLPLKAGRTRAFLRVQSGCGNNCAYCIVPLVRSRVSSVPADDIARQVIRQTGEGCREIVLTGTEIGTYRDGDTGLKELLERLLDETTIERLRVSSLQPPEISPELISLWRDGRLCPHFHVSLQSGSDAVLRRMRRRYSLEGYLEALSMIRGTVPEAAVTTDIIVGFPGETEAEFDESLAVCREAGFARIHVFPYSARPGTTAAAMPEQVPETVKTGRARRMLLLAGQTAGRFAEKYIGQTVEVLFEQGRGRIWSGHTGHYLKVYLGSRRDIANALLPVRLVKPYRDGLWGELEL